ncbi:pseudouridine synthase [Colwellia sp. TT2012]|uniref:pseudouridine synthase n=1 Tax=Colwellia sp. TT2012 TaxID=1720342 RepID=UPI001E32C31F
MIEDNRVTINDKVPELGTKVLEGDVVKVDGYNIEPISDDKSDRIYIAYNKPTGITCTTEKHVRGNIIDAIGHKKRIFPIGRLDKPSEGLIFLTSDGDIVNKILRAENAHDKEYIVTVDKPISERFILRMSRGVPILGTITKPCIVRVESRFVFTIVLTQGLNRQIRRMCEYLDYEVLKLKRSRIMNVELGNLSPGQWRDLTKEEMAEINAAVQHSSKTAIDTAQPKAPLDMDQLTKKIDEDLNISQSTPYLYTPKKTTATNQDTAKKLSPSDIWPTHDSKPAERNTLKLNPKK